MSASGTNDMRIHWRRSGLAPDELDAAIDQALHP